jgi:hypothetical protein
MPASNGRKPGPRQAVLEALAVSLNALDGVFSTPQWGGRAYKLPGSGGRRDKPKLVAFVCPSDDGTVVTVSFKLDPARAEAVVERHEWIEPHSFRTLAPAGWLTARVRTARHVKALVPLLTECHGQLAPTPGTSPGAGRGSERRSDEATKGTNSTHRGHTPHLDAVMEEARARGWTPPADVAADDGWSNP